MASDQTNLTLLVLFTLISPIISQSIIQQFTQPHHLFHDTLYCDSWRFSVETNDAGTWRTIPKKCEDFVKDYATGERYLSDSEVVADASIEFLKTVELSGKDAWVFDIDETLLSNVPYYALIGFE
ncbi:Acid phosphatase 1 [Heracleum sosnowskyi]|uniref:Acid phosphatase 1 n=1 Tax=Heracleum sosnowskyi TaxID=360622 RepID=A0AAD8M083_9APIA|nr:Acid phosphatase 1 [Heracleum sosnowskyi]